MHAPNVYTHTPAHCTHTDGYITVQPSEGRQKTIQHVKRNAVEVPYSFKVTYCEREGLYVEQDNSKGSSKKGKVPSLSKRHQKAQSTSDVHAADNTHSLPTDHKSSSSSVLSQNMLSSPRAAAATKPSVDSIAEHTPESGADTHTHVLTHAHERELRTHHQRTESMPVASALHRSRSDTSRLRLHVPARPLSPSNAPNASIASLPLLRQSRYVCVCVCVCVYVYMYVYVCVCVSM
jgi:hypothetical protein